VLIDHGHFQYNCISIGLAVLAVVAIACRRDILGSVLFCLSLNHKQMGLLLCPSFFIYWAAACSSKHTGAKVELRHAAPAPPHCRNELRCSLHNHMQISAISLVRTFCSQVMA